MFTMRKFTLSAAVPLFCAGLLIAALPAAAQEETTAPEPGTDMSSYLTNSNFDGNYDGWTAEGEGDPNTGAIVNIGNNLCEAYQEQHNGLLLYQDITGLPMGVYKLTAEGFYRPGWNDEGAAYANGDPGVCPARFFISTATQKLTANLCCLYATDYRLSSGGIGGYANSMAEARTVFDATDDYLVTMDNLYVGGDGTLRLGIEGIAASYGGLWSIWGDFTLTYKSELNLDGYRTLADGVANEIFNLAANYRFSGGTAIEDAVYEMQDNMYGETLDEVEASMTQLNEWVEEMQAANEACANLEAAMAEYNEWIGQGYPGAADLTAVYESAASILDGAEKEDGTPYYAADIDSCVTALEEAIRNYRMSVAIPAEGLDVTFAIPNANFTNEEGHASSEGWMTNNTKADGSAASGDFRLNTFGPEGNVKNWWNNWSGTINDCANMDVYTEMHNLPAGYYTFSLIHTTDGAITNQRAYANSVYDQKESLLPTKMTQLGNSGWQTDVTYWDTLYVDSILVGSDGYLRVGMHSNLNSTTSAGWFCITDCKLTYYGSGEGSINDLMRDALLARGDTLLTQDFLAVQKAYLTTGMETLRAADITTDEAANAAFDAFTVVLDSCEAAVDSMADFRTTYYDPIVAMIETAPTDELATTIGIFKGMCDQMIAAETTTVEMFYGMIKPQAAAFLNYANAYITANEYAAGSVDEVKNVITQVLTTQNAAVTENPLVSATAAKNATDLLEFAQVYDNALLTMAVEGIYNADTLSVISGLVSDAVTAMLADQDNIDAYTANISLLINRLRLTEEAAVLPDGSRDLTSWIVNPSLEDLTDAGGVSGATNVIPNGWEGYTRNGNGSFWTSTSMANHGVIPDGEVKMEAWSSAPSTLQFNYYQTLKGMPAGEYRVTVMAHDIQSALANGASKFYVKTSEGREYIEPIYSHPVLTGDTLAFDTIFVQDADGNNTTEIERIDTTLDVNNDIYDLYTIDGVWITNDGTDMTIGVRRDSLGVCNWFSADDFHLYLIARFNTGIEEVGADQGNDLVVYSRDGYIYVEGADEYTIYNISGVAAYGKDQQLQPGYYIVQTKDGRTAKVIVD